MRLFDVLGPVMIGPSSSHTAGAARIGYTAQKLLGEVPAKADIGLYGSFATTGKGHGTDRALVAGLLGLRPDDPRLPDSFALAEEQGMTFTIHPVELRSAHPNTAVLRLTARSGRELSLKAASVGGGRIRVTEIDGVPADFGGDSNTLIIHNEDTPGCIAAGEPCRWRCGASTLRPCRCSGRRWAATRSWCWNATPTSPTRWNSSWP